MQQKQYIVNFREFSGRRWDMAVWRFKAFNDEHAKERVLNELLTEPRQRKELKLREETHEISPDITGYTTEGRPHHRYTALREVELT